MLINFTGPSTYMRQEFMKSMSMGDTQSNHTVSSANESATTDSFSRSMSRSHNMLDNIDLKLSSVAEYIPSSSRKESGMYTVMIYSYSYVCNLY